MGHLRLGNLPQTQKWLEVISLIAEGSATAEIAAATLEASKKGLKYASDDPGLVHAFWLLTQFPTAARKTDFGHELRKIGLSVSNQPSLMEIIGKFSDALDQKNREHGRKNDLTEIAQMSATESLAAIAGARAQSLFGMSAETVQGAFKDLTRSKQFSHIAHDFFSRLTKKYLSYYLSRELSNHVGPERRFRNSDDHSKFNQALETHCRQTAHIMQAYADDWFSKTNFEGGISQENARKFVDHAIKKIEKELSLRGAKDAN